MTGGNIFLITSPPSCICSLLRVLFGQLVTSIAEGLIPVKIVGSTYWMRGRYYLLFTIHDVLLFTKHIHTMFLLLFFQRFQFQTNQVLHQVLLTPIQQDFLVLLLVLVPMVLFPLPHLRPLTFRGFFRPVQQAPVNTTSTSNRKLSAKKNSIPSFSNNYNTAARPCTVTVL